MAGTKAMKMSTVYYRRKVINAKTISWDNNNVTLAYDSSAGKFANSATSYLTIKDGDTDMSSIAPITLTSKNVVAIWFRGSSSGSIGQGTVVNGKGNLYVKITQVSAESGTISASSAVTPGMSSVINVVRVASRYTFELVCNPTQITYNLTTGVKSAEKFSINLYVNKNDGTREKATFADYGTLNWRYVGVTTWTAYSNQATTEASITPDFSKDGIEVMFVDGNGIVCDTKTLSILKISNGGDAYSVICGSTNISLMLESLDHGEPIGDVINIVGLTKNGTELSSGVGYNVPASSDGDEQSLNDVSTSATNCEYNGWIFNYSLSGGKLKSTLVKVLEGSPTSVQIPIDVYYNGGSVFRKLFVSYSVILQGPAGRSYKPNVAVMFDETLNTQYTWNDEKRDFVYYGFGDGEQKSYSLFGIKEYGMTTTLPPSSKGGDARWEYVSDQSTLITNCIFGTNAIMGGFTFTADTMTSQHKDDDGNPTITIDGKNGMLQAVGADISGVINATSGTFSNCVIDEGCEIHNENGWNLLGDSTGPGWILKGIGVKSINFSIQSPNYYVRMHNGIGSNGVVNHAHMIDCKGYNGMMITAEGTALDVNSGNSIFRGNVTMYGITSGLRLQTTTMSSTGTIPSGSDVICFTNSSSITVTMPSASTYKGRILFLKKTGSGGVTLKGSFVESGGTGNTATSREHVGNAKSMIYVSNGTSWIEFYCG